MKYMKRGKTDINVSVIGFGTWGLGGGNVWSDMKPDAVQTSALLDEAEALGINYIDTAPVYGMGTSEKLLAEALNGRRDHFILQTKCSLNWRNEGGNFHYERDGYTVNNDTRATAVRKDVEDSLTRLHTDYIDVLAVHYVCHSWPVQETMEALSQLKKEGKIRAIALSNSQPADLDEYQKYGTIAAVQEQFSLISPQHGNEYFDTCRKYGTAFQGYGILEEGFLTSSDYADREFPASDVRGQMPWTHDPQKAALHKLFESTLIPMSRAHHCSVSNLVQAWTLKQYPDLNLLTGFRHAETMRDTVKCLDISLSEQELLSITNAAHLVQQ